MEQLRRFIRFNCAIVCLTNSETSTIAKMSDVCLTYYMPIDRVQYGDLTTQVPVIFILEKIGKKFNTYYKILRSFSLKAYAFISFFCL